MDILYIILDNFIQFYMKYFFPVIVRDFAKFWNVKQRAVRANRSIDRNKNIFTNSL